MRTGFKMRKSLVVVAMFILCCFGLSGCGSDAPAVDPVTAQKDANKAAVETIAEFAVKVQELKFKYFLALTDKNVADPTKPVFLPLNLVVSNQEFNDLLNAINDLYGMEEKVLAAFAQLGYQPGTKAAKAALSDSKIAQWFAKKTGFKADVAVDIADTLAPIAQKDKDVVWKTVASGNLSFGAKNYDEWYGKLKDGSYNLNANDIRNHLIRNAEDADGFNVYEVAMNSRGTSKTQVAFEVGGDAVKMAYDVGKIVVGKTVPVVGQTIQVIEYLEDFNSGKPVTDIVKDGVKNYALNKLGLSDGSDAYNALVTEKAKLAKSIQQAAAANNESKPLDVTTNTVGLGAVTVVDNATSGSSTGTSLVVMNNTKTTIPDDEYELILSLMAGTPKEPIPVAPGNYDLLVVTPDGMPGVSAAVEVKANDIAVAVVDTSALDPVAPVPPAAGITAVPSAASVLVGSSPKLTISATATVIAPLQITITNPGNALMAAGDQITNETLVLSSVAGNQLVVDLNLSAAKTYTFAVTVKDAIGKTYTASASIVASQQPVPPPAPVGSSRYVGAANFTTDPGKADEIIWRLTATTTMSLAAGSTTSGPVEVTITGTGNGAPVSGTASGVWENGTFRSYGKIGPTGGAASEQIDFAFSGNYSGLTDQTLTGTISAFTTDLHTFTSNLTP